MNQVPYPEIELELKQNNVNPVAALGALLEALYEDHIEHAHPTYMTGLQCVVEALDEQRFRARNAYHEAVERNQTDGETFEDLVTTSAGPAHVHALDVILRIVQAIGDQAEAKAKEQSLAVAGPGQNAPDA
jgi:hypothetical protein